MTHAVPNRDDVYMYLKSWEEENIWVIANGSERERRINFSEITHWFEGVSTLRDLVSGEEVSYQPGMELRIGAMQARLFLLVKAQP